MVSERLRDTSVPGKVVLIKGPMGKKTVFRRASAERKDLEVLQVFIEPDTKLDVPIGLKIDVELLADSEGSGPGAAKNSALPE